MEEAKNGGPQGFVISSPLFSFFVTSFVTSAEVSIACADNNHAAITEVDINTIADNLTAAANEMAAWVEEVGLGFLASTLFTP